MPPFRLTWHQHVMATTTALLPRGHVLLGAYAEPRRWNTSLRSRRGPMNSILRVSEERTGDMSWPCFLECHRRRIESSTKTINPVTTIILDFGLVTVHGSFLAPRRITYSATSGIFSYTESSLIHMDDGGTQPPLACSSTASIGVKISGIRWAMVLDVRRSIR